MFEQFVLINGIITHFSLVGAAQGIFLFIMLIRRLRADKVFSFIVLFISYELALHYVYKAHMWPEYLPLFLIKDTLGYLYGYLILLYVRSLFRINFKMRIADLLHFLPAIIFFVLSLILNTPYLGYGTYSIIDFDESGITRFRFYSQNIKYLILFCYLIFSLKEVFGYRRKHKMFFPGMKGGATTWLLVFLFSVFTLWLLPFLSFNFYYVESFAYFWTFFNVIKIPFLPEILSLVNSFFAVISIYSAGYYILGKVSPDTDANEIISSAYSGDSPSHAKYRKNLISETVKEEYLKRIKNCMDVEKPYLDPDFSIKEFSEKIDVSTHNISQIINETFGKNFFNFVNDYRIDFAAGIIADTEKEVNILHASLDSGFNSKSVFNTAFKKKYGMTPSQFRNTNLEKALKPSSKDISGCIEDTIDAESSVIVAKKIQ